MKNLIILTALIITLATATACFFGSETAEVDQSREEARDASSPADTGSSNPVERNEPSDNDARGNDNARRDNENPGQNVAGQSVANTALAQEHRERCQFWALNNLRPAVYAEFSKLDPATMSDLERILWKQNLRGGLPTIIISEDADEKYATIEFEEPYCQEYWSEPLSSENADFRNHSYEERCRDSLRQGITQKYYDLAQTAGNRAYQDTYQPSKDLLYQTPNQYVRILQWIDMSGEQLLNDSNPPYLILQRHYPYEYAHGSYTPYSTEELEEYRKEHEHPLDLEWVGIIDATAINASSELRACRFYYPQVFYGYWVPIDSEITQTGNQDEDTELPRYNASKMPLYLPRSVRDARVMAGYPLGTSDEGSYYLCRSDSSTESVGYYYVQHPAGDYCERMP